MRVALPAALAAAVCALAPASAPAPARADATPPPRPHLRVTSPDPRLAQLLSRVFLRDCRGARRAIDRLRADPGVDATGLLVASIRIAEA